MQAALARGRGCARTRRAHQEFLVGLLPQLYQLPSVLSGTKAFSWLAVAVSVTSQKIRHMREV